jgi:hypothetical protein
MRSRMIIIGIVLIAFEPARGDDDRPSPAVSNVAAGRSTPRSSAVKPNPASVRSQRPSPIDISTSMPNSETTDRDAEQARVAALGAIDRLKEAAAKQAGDPKADPSGMTSKFIDVLQKRVELIDKWRKQRDARLAALHPQVDPKAQAEEQKKELARLEAKLKRAEADPTTLLPEVFLANSATIDDALLEKMKEALDSARNDLDDRKTADKALDDDFDKTKRDVEALKAERIKAQRTLESLEAQMGDKQAAVAAAARADDVALAKQKLINYQWELRIARERPAAIEARATLGTELGRAFEVQAKVLDVQIELAAKTVEQMNQRYKSLLDRRRADLQAAAVRAERSAEKSKDPIERHRAKRSVELFELEQQILIDEQRAATNVYLSPQELTVLADRAEADLEHLKKLANEVERDAHIAARLNHEFRRMGSNRSARVRDDLARASFQLNYLENELTEVERTLLDDAREDRFELEALLSAIPESRRKAARAVVDSIEAERRGLLDRRRRVLENMVERAESAHKQIVRRLRAIDEKYAFLQSRVFWIRDAEPLGAESIEPLRREVVRVVGAVDGIFDDVVDRSMWRRTSSEFVAAVALTIVVPAASLLLGVALRRRLERSEPVRVVVASPNS